MFLWIGSAILIFLLTLVINAVRLTSKQQQFSPLSIKVDTPNAIQRFAGTIHFQTIFDNRSKECDGSLFLALHQYLQKTFPLLHRTLKQEVINQYSLLYQWAGKSSELPPILLMSHLDVVPIEPQTEDQWQYPPFSGAVENGFVWGRGTLDFKTGAAAIMESIEMLLQEGFQPERTIYLALGHDEETGGTHGGFQIAKYLETQKIYFEYILDEGIPIIQGMIPGISLPIAPVSIAEKGFVNIRLTVQTEGGHASTPPARTALGILSTAIHDLESHQMPIQWASPIPEMFTYLSPEMPFRYRLVFSNLWLFKPLIQYQLSKSPPTNALLRTTMAATMMSGGVKENILPQKASAVINCRILPQDSIQEVLEHIRRTVQNSQVEIQILHGPSSEPSEITNLDTRSLRILQRTIGQIYPNTIFTPALLVGTTDSRHYHNLTDNTFRFSPWLVNQEDLYRIHGVNERISIQAYEQCVQFYYQLLFNSAQ
ncbi:MAG: M20/M25/M40 family metallo-hydrolase [SAR324 cluster bacterium]|nr:M20/M25/M40 family metallo-hydrolase [SAR324 cluster bacterium]